MTDRDSFFFSIRPIADIVEQATAVKFFSIYAENVSTFRGQMLSPTGIPLLIHNIKHLHNDTNEWSVERLCSSLVESSEFEWCCSTLVGMDICPSLAKILMYVVLISNTRDVLSDYLRVYQ